MLRSLRRAGQLTSSLQVLAGKVRNWVSLSSGAWNVSRSASSHKATCWRLQLVH